MQQAVWQQAAIAGQSAAGGFCRQAMQVFVHHMLPQHHGEHNLYFYRRVHAHHRVLQDKFPKNNWVVLLLTRQHRFPGHRFPLPRFTGPTVSFHLSLPAACFFTTTLLALGGPFSRGTRGAELALGDTPWVVRTLSANGTVGPFWGTTTGGDTPRAPGTHHGFSPLPGQRLSSLGTGHPGVFPPLDPLVWGQHSLMFAPQGM